MHRRDATVPTAMIAGAPEPNLSSWWQQYGSRASLKASWGGGRCWEVGRQESWVGAGDGFDLKLEVGGGGRSEQKSSGAGYQTSKKETSAAGGGTSTYVVRLPS